MRLPVLILAATCCALGAAKADNDPPEAVRACSEYYFGYPQFASRIELGFDDAKEKVRRLIADCQKSRTHCGNTLKLMPKAMEKAEGRTMPAELTLTCPGVTIEPAAVAPPAAAPRTDKPDPPEAVRACTEYFNVLDALFDNTVADSDKGLVAPFKLRRTMYDCTKSRRYCLSTVEMINKKRNGSPLPTGFTLTCPR
jgi:hypothetical protein